MSNFQSLLSDKTKSKPGQNTLSSKGSVKQRSLNSVLQRASLQPELLKQTEVSQLQRMIGNQKVKQLLQKTDNSKARIQRKEDENQDKPFYEEAWDSAKEVSEDVWEGTKEMSSEAWEGAKELNEEYKLVDRGLGLMQGIGGIGEAALGGAGVVIPEPATSIIGGGLVFHGIDTAMAGFKQAITGEQQKTATEQAATKGLETIGVDKENSETGGMIVDTIAGMLNPFSKANKVVGSILKGTGKASKEVGQEVVKKGAKEVGKKRIPKNVTETFGNAPKTKTYQTYTKTNKITGEIYVGRTSGIGTPLDNLAKRDKSHHMNEKGFGPAVIDKSNADKNAIRGREQQMIEAYGGAKSQKGVSGNSINSISDKNKKRQLYIDAANEKF